MPISPEIKAQGQAVERKIEEAIVDKSAFFLELTDDELSALLMSKLDEATGVRDVSVEISPGFLDISGHLAATPSVPFSGRASVDFFAGVFDIALESISVAIIPVPGVVKEELQPLIDQPRRHASAWPPSIRCWQRRWRWQRACGRPTRTARTRPLPE